MSFTKTGPRWAHAPQAEGEGSSALDTASALTESRMRQSLERLGGRSAATHATRPFHGGQSFGGQSFANRPRRHGFVRDGEVPVEQARRRRPEAAPRPEAELQPRPDPEARVAAAERAARESREQARILSTRLGHAELRLSEAGERADREAARADAAEAALAEATARLDALRAEAEHWRQAANLADDAVEPSETEQEPVQWWVEPAGGAAPEALRD